MQSIQSISNLSTVEVEVSVQVLQTEGKLGVQLQTSIAFIHFFFTTIEKHENEGILLQAENKLFLVGVSKQFTVSCNQDKKVKPKGV